MAEETFSTTPSMSLMNGKAPAGANTSPDNHRSLGRSSTFAHVTNSLTRRRGSVLSDSLDETRQSIRSSTDNLLLPRPIDPHLISTGEHSHWHSAPLVLALLPALGGLFFTNGSALITDLTLLGLAAIFLNWSVKLPWEWYHSAQSTQSTPYPPVEDFSTDDAITEEGSEIEGEKLKAFHEAEKNPTSEFPKTKNGRSLSQSSSASELRLHELIALSTCIVSPVIGAWLLHTIRSQLSRPSEGLVSNYNLTIFLLAAELRPLAHLIRLVQARTLYLQRSLNPSPIERAIGYDPQKLQDLSARLDDLEAHIASAATPLAKNSLSPATTTQVTAQVRKSLQPDIEALNRAVRRYEKRATLLSMQTESRLQDLEYRMADAITLAAAAERSIAQRPKHSSALTLLDWVCAVIVLPVQTIMVCINLPARAVRTTVTAVEGYISRQARKQIRVTGRGSGGENNGTASASGGYEKRSAGKARGMKKAF